MNKILIDNLYNFHCPRWNEIPDGNFSNGEMCKYINDSFAPMFIHGELLTNTMVQNYVKWNVIPSPNRRKYTKEHIARLIVISVYKNIYSLSKIKRGSIKLINHKNIEEAYDNFAKELEDALKRVFQSVYDGKKTLDVSSFSASIENVEAALAANVFALTLLGNILTSNK